MRTPWAATALAACALAVAPVPADAAPYRPGHIRQTTAAAHRYLALGDSCSSGSGAGTPGAPGAPGLRRPGVRTQPHGPPGAVGRRPHPRLLRLRRLRRRHRPRRAAGAGGRGGRRHHPGGCERRRQRRRLRQRPAGLPLACRRSTVAGCRAAVAEAAGCVRTELPGLFDGPYRAVRDAAPWARGVVVGYPHLCATGVACPGEPAAEKRAIPRAGADLLHGTIAARAEAAGFAGPSTPAPPSPATRSARPGRGWTAAPSSPPPRGTAPAVCPRSRRRCTGPPATAAGRS